MNFLEGHWAPPTPFKGSKFRALIYEIIFGSDTKLGKLFDIVLVAAIILSVSVVVLDSILEIHILYGRALFILEWVFTIIFTIEYIMRVLSVQNPKAYVLSFMGIVDLLSTLPSYLGIFVGGQSYALTFRLLRIMRIFRVLKLNNYIAENKVMVQALSASKRKLLVFFLFIIMLVTILGSLMFAVEGPQHGYTSIPESIYWAIVTLTTVGYGDISPQTPMGQFLASLVMMLGYTIIAVPTGIVTAEMTKSHHLITKKCKKCKLEEHPADANYCHRCGDEFITTTD